MQAKLSWSGPHLPSVAGTGVGSTDGLGHTLQSHSARRRLAADRVFEYTCAPATSARTRLECRCIESERRCRRRPSPATSLQKHAHMPCLFDSIILGARHLPGPTGACDASLQRHQSSVHAQSFIHMHSIEPLSALDPRYGNVLGAQAL